MAACHRHRAQSTTHPQEGTLCFKKCRGTVESKNIFVVLEIVHNIYRVYRAVLASSSLKDPRALPEKWSTAVKYVSRTHGRRRPHVPIPSAHTSPGIDWSSCGFSLDLTPLPLNACKGQFVVHPVCALLAGSGGKELEKQEYTE